MPRDQACPQKVSTFQALGLVQSQRLPAQGVHVLLITPLACSQARETRCLRLSAWQPWFRGGSDLARPSALAGALSRLAHGAADLGASFSEPAPPPGRPRAGSARRPAGCRDPESEPAPAVRIPAGALPKPRPDPGLAPPPPRPRPPHWPRPSVPPVAAAPGPHPSTAILASSRSLALSYLSPPLPPGLTAPHPCPGPCTHWPRSSGPRPPLQVRPAPGAPERPRVKVRDALSFTSSHSRLRAGPRSSLSQCPLWAAWSLSGAGAGASDPQDAEAVAEVSVCGQNLGDSLDLSRERGSWRVGASRASEKGTDSSHLLSLKCQRAFTPAAVSARAEPPPLGAQEDSPLLAPGPLRDLPM